MFVKGAKFPKRGAKFVGNMAPGGAYFLGNLARGGPYFGGAKFPGTPAHMNSPLDRNKIYLSLHSSRCDFIPV